MKKLPDEVTRRKRARIVLRIRKRPVYEAKARMLGMRYNFITHAMMPVGQVGQPSAGPHSIWLHADTLEPLEHMERQLIRDELRKDFNIQDGHAFIYPEVN